MSDISEKVRNALYSAMHVGSVVGTGKASAIYVHQAPEVVAYPFIVFNRVPGVVDYAMKATLAGERDRWFIKCFSDKDAAMTASKGPYELNEDILALAETAIGTSLTVSGQTCSYVERVADIPPLVEVVNDRTIWMNGFQLETYVS